jgi:acetone carboxylase gamma subunit
MTDWSDYDDLMCPVCGQIDQGFTIYPDKHKRVIRWDCGHTIYRSGKLRVTKHE